MKDKDVTHLMTLSCSNRECMLRVRIGRILSKPALQIGAFRYCPVCGSAAMAMNDVDESYWEVIAESLSLPIEVTRTLYDLWEPNKQPKFVDFVNEIKQEVLAGK